MTNFFEQQQAARTRTFWLIVLFVVSTLLITALIYPLAVLLFGNGGKTFYEGEYDPFLLLGSLAGVWSVVGIGSALKAGELSDGGKSVAVMLGGREILATTREPRERRLLNIVEEMALASGLPVPAVYVLDGEESINAFAAGMQPGDAVVAVSRGSLNYLTRDELQGVVAHEFSHILNGDMRLNFRMIVLIAGLIGLSILGRILIDAAGRGSSRRSEKDDPRGYLVLLGIGLYVIGLLGAFFGWLLQAAVSRQREYLADASAVQFTRNPDGIAGALKKIGAHASHGEINAPQAGEAAHLFFVSGLSRLFATHPPLAERIRRIQPNWDGRYPVVQVTPDPRPEEMQRSRSRRPTLPGMEQMPVPVLLELSPDQAVDRVGTMPADSQQYAADLLASLPPRLREATEEPFQARAVIFGLLLDRNAEVRANQLEALRDIADATTANLTRAFEDPLRQLPESLRLPLVDLCLPTLRQLSQRQHREFRHLVNVLTEADQRLSVFEYVLDCVLERHLDSVFAPPRALPPSPNRRKVLADTAVVLAFLAWEGHSDESAARAGFTRAIQGVVGREPLPGMADRSSANLAALDRALKSLAAASLRDRKRILTACVTLILADRQVTVREFEVTRAISDTLGLPMPPLPLTVSR